MTRLIRFGVFLAVFALAAVTISAQRPSVSPKAVSPLLTGAPSMFKVTVTQVEIYNGTSWTTLFTGTAQLDMMTAAGATFPGISAVYLPRGTYTQLRVTFSNSFVLKGALIGAGVTTYYTTAATLASSSASVASTVSDDLAQVTIRNPTWGNLGDAVVQTMNIGPLTVSNGTTYTPTLTFDLSSGLALYPNSPSGHYFTLGTVTITLV